MKLQTKEKFSFLRLAHYLARVDSDYGEKEHEIIEEYCVEMGIENDDIFDVDTFDLEDTLKNFKTKKSKKIVMLELMILIHADDSFDFKEKELIQDINKTFGFSKRNMDYFSQWGKAVASLYEQGQLLIEEE
ncbi:TerB family tellurite resistance protein [Arcobacter sp. CECT 8985]|uniref:TerB family tellurite resistance protein n=1 Tax=Arcobacter sp. CECT 8985 TaxID=1935424 RepID=UPI002159DE41|nr:TerB family tellurite resistance protein [Arcobacter sp. CECT 8985]